MNRLSDKEIQNIGRLLMSTDEKNQQLGLELLAHHPYALAQIRQTFEVYHAFHPKDEKAIAIQVANDLGTLTDNPVYALYLAKYDQNSLGLHPKLVEDFIAAEQAYRSLIVQIPTYSIGYAYLANFIQNKIKKYPFAVIKFFRLAYQYHPNISWVSFNLAHALIENTPQEELPSIKKEVINTLKHSYQTSPRPKVLWVSGLFLKKYFQDYKQAAHYYKKCIKQYPNYFTAFNSYAMLLLEQEDYQKAKDYAFRAEKIMLQQQETGTIHHIYDTLGHIYWKGDQDFDKAEDFFIKAVENNPLHEESIEGAIQMFEEAQDYNKLLFWQEKKLDAQPHDIMLLFELAQNYLKVDDTKTAKRYLQQILAIHPNYHKANALLEELKKED